MTTEKVEMPRVVRVHGLPRHGRTIRIVASENERTAIANRLGLVSVGVIEGDLTVIPAIARETHVEGAIRAEIVQSCVVSGDPVPADLVIQVHRRYSEDADALMEPDDEDIPDPEEDVIDPIVDGEIDVGEAVVEELALQMPAYPRKPDAAFVAVAVGPDGKRTTPAGGDNGDKTGKESPFSALADLKKKMKSKD